MTKHITLFLLIIAVGLVSSSNAHAQVMMPTEEPLVNQYVADSYNNRKASWWNLLGRQLARSVDKPHQEIGEAELQNIIFFASNHKNKVKLVDAVPALLDVYRFHEDDQLRIMSVAALGAIGDGRSIVALKHYVEDEQSERVEKIVKATINKYYQEQ